VWVSDNHFDGDTGGDNDFESCLTKCEDRTGCLSARPGVHAPSALSIFSCFLAILYGRAAAARPLLTRLGPRRMFHYVRSGFEHKCGVPSEGLPGLTAQAAAFLDADNAAAYAIGTCSHRR